MSFKQHTKIKNSLVWQESICVMHVTLPLSSMQVASSLSSHERPLTLLFCWLMAKERHVRKYAQFYTNMGIDVLKVRISPFDLLRPTKGSQVRRGERFLYS